MRKSRTYGLEVETNAKANLSRVKCARGNEKRVEERLTLFRRCVGREGVKVYELTAETENSLVKYIIKLNDRSKPQVFVQVKLASDVEVKEKLTGALTGVTGQVARLTNSWQRKATEDCRIDRFASSAPM